MLHACILLQQTTVSATICSSKLRTKKQTTKNGKNHENMKQNRLWWRDRDVINHVICFHTATELCSWYNSCNIKNNNHTDTKLRENRIRHDLRGIPRFGGIMCSKKSRHPLKSNMGSIAATYPKIKRVPLFFETFQCFALRYWTMLRFWKNYLFRFCCKCLFRFSSYWF